MNKCYHGLLFQEDCPGERTRELGAGNTGQESSASLNISRFCAVPTQSLDIAERQEETRAGLERSGTFREFEGFVVTPSLGQGLYGTGACGKGVNWHPRMNSSISPWLSLAPQEPARPE